MSTIMGAGEKNAHMDNQVLQLIHRFGVPLGVGDKTAAQVCQENQIDCHTLLAVVNFAINKEYHYSPDIHIPTLRKYLENAHIYFMQFQLPRIRQMLLEAINLAGVDQKIPLLIIRFYDEYVEEIRAHIQHEDEFAFEHHPTDDQHVAAKAIELNADAILVSQTVTQKDVHIQNLTNLIELMEAEGLRDKMIVVCGGPRISHELAKELGYDAGFGANTYADDVISFVAQEYVNRNTK